MSYQVCGVLCKEVAVKVPIAEFVVVRSLEAAHSCTLLVSTPDPSHCCRHWMLLDAFMLHVYVRHRLAINKTWNNTRGRMWACVRARGGRWAWALVGNVQVTRGQQRNSFA